jgi:copper chaperone
MIAFEVKDMTCGHCVSTITKAVRAADKDAKVQIDLATHRVQIEPTETNAAELGDAIREAGYTPVEVSAGTTEASAVRKQGGCCCG